MGKTKHQWTKWIATFTVFFTLLSTFGTLTLSVAHAEAGGLDLQVKSGILMDATSGTVLYEKNADESLPPASMTKMMTAYLVMEAIKQGKLKWEDKVVASTYANFLGAMPGGSVVFLADGETHSVKDMVEAMEVNSANDATLALAEKVGVTESQFVKMMNNKAKEFGMKQTKFVNSTGLPKKDLGKYGKDMEAEDNMMSARDLAILARHLVQDYPEILQFSSIAKSTFPNGVVMRNYDLMVPGRNSKYTYEGLDGLKTGHTDTAKYCFTGTAKRGELRLISVVMGAETEPARFTETRKLLDYGFNNFEYKSILKGKEAIKGSEMLPVTKGVALEVPVVSERSLGLAVKKGESDGYYFKVSPKTDALLAPIKAGQVVGKAELFYKDKVSGKDTAVGLSVNMIAQENVEKASWFRLLMRALKDWFFSIFKGVKGIF